MEKLGEILNENPNGLVQLRDELVSLLKGFDRSGHESDRGFYLEAWNGTDSFSFDRIGRGTVIIESTTLSLIGCIQPGPLHEHLASMAAGGAGDDGFMQRVQLAVWPDAAGTWHNVDRPPDAAAWAAAFKVFEWIDGLAPDAIGAERDPHDPDGLPFLRFTPMAQAKFDRWRESLEAKVRSGGECPALEAHLSKYRSLVPSLALIFHLADAGRGGVTEGPLQKAIGWAEYLETHARRVYSPVLDLPAVPALALARKISAGRLSDPFTLHDVYASGWKGLAKPAEASGAVERLMALGWLREAHDEDTGGRPSTRYHINPGVRDEDFARQYRGSTGNLQNP
jgi:putative DNA primase/helicase